MSTLSNKWNEFQENVVPQGTSPTDVQVLRGAFYAGASSVLLIINDHDDDTPVLRGLYEDVHAYAQENSADAPGSH
jgi:hypothetical protein